PTRYVSEAQPLVILEALSAGIPVIATTRGCICDLLSSGGTALPEGADFVPAAVRLIADWAGDRVRLAALGATAPAPCVALRRSALGELDSLVERMTMAA